MIVVAAESLNNPQRQDLGSQGIRSGPWYRAIVFVLSLSGMRTGNRPGRRESRHNRSCRSQGELMRFHWSSIGPTRRKCITCARQ